MLKDFNLHTIVRLPDGVFAPYTDIPANLLFFEHGEATQKVWYYEMSAPDGRKKYSKTKPIQNEEFEAISVWWHNRTENDNAWCIPVSTILQYDGKNKLISVNLDRKNPNRKSDNEYIDPSVAMTMILEKEKEIWDLMTDIQALIQADKEVAAL